MRILCVAVCAAVFCLGCELDGDKGSWEEAMKDARGDNMQMRSSFAGLGGFDDRPVQSKPSN